MLDQAQAPIVWAGGGARRCGRRRPRARRGPRRPGHHDVQRQGHPADGPSAARGVVGRGAVDAPSGRARRPVPGARHPLLAGDDGELDAPDPGGARPRRPRRRPVRAHLPAGRGDRLGRRPLLPGAPRRRREPPARATARRPCARRSRGANSEVGAQGVARRDRADARAARHAARGRDRDRRHDGRARTGRRSTSTASGPARSSTRPPAPWDAASRSRSAPRRRTPTGRRSPSSATAGS